MDRRDVHVVGYPVPERQFELEPGRHSTYRGRCRTSSRLTFYNRQKRDGR
jgi:hypothetical protein